MTVLAPSCAVVLSAMLLPAAIHTRVRRFVRLALARVVCASLAIAPAAVKDGKRFASVMSAARSVVEDDPHLWLEDIYSDASLDWCRERNRATIAQVGAPAETHAYKRILEISDSKEKIPLIGRVGAKFYYNFWTDAEHVKGIWRRTTLASYRQGGSGGGSDRTAKAKASKASRGAKNGETEWHTVLDIDALNVAEGRTEDAGADDARVAWVWHSYALLDEGRRGAWDRALIFLSPGGKDADAVREFDLVAEQFVPPTQGGFELPVSKSRAAYRTRDELLVGCAFRDDEMTSSGYPRVVKSWRRGTPFSEAATVFEGERSDISAAQYLYHDRGTWHELRVRQLTFYTSRMWHRTPDPTKAANEDTAPFRPLPVPDDADCGTFGDALTIELRSDWTPTPTPEGGFGELGSENGTTTGTSFSSGGSGAPRRSHRFVIMSHHES
jgi:prolyl oligopeptidase